MSSLRPMIFRMMLSGCLNILALAAPGKQAVRVITWNVADNSLMDGAFDNSAIDKLLGLGGSNSKVADIYLVGLQELCYKCNKKDLMNVPKVFQSRLKSSGNYEVIDITGTLESAECEALCKRGSHGTTALFVLAKKGLVKAHQKGSYNQGCSDKTPPNKEKGVAYMRLSLSSGQSVCAATSHLESRSPKFRRQCLKGFFQAASKSVDWSSCNFQFISGDFNTRTSASAPKGQEEKRPSNAKVQQLKLVDEMAGKNAFGGDSDWKGNMLDFINSVQKNVFKESAFSFLPTYKFTDKCKGTKPCYKTSRPMSWTDRILHSGGTSIKYDSYHDLKFSDHRPVIEDFLLA